MKILGRILAIIGIACISIITVGIIKKPKSVYSNNPKEHNPFEGKRVKFVKDDSDYANADGERGHLEEITDSDVSFVHERGLYECIIKRCFDVVISLFGLIILSPVFLILSIAIYLDDPGPVLFTQKRLGKNKRYFALHKFRSMKMSTPHDVPTHMLKDPESYITRVGKLLRKMSLDELPQLWDIFLGNMSMVGPRPGLWNQDILTACRDEYGANDVMPGLTGLAQINGRDELEIHEKARIDGEYCKNITFRMDLACLLMTVANVLKSKGIIEGGTGTLEKLKNKAELHR